MNDEIWKLEKNPRRDPFADMAKVGEILEQEGKLSIARIQRKLGIGFTYAHRILDYLINAGELYHAGDGVYLSKRLTTHAPDVLYWCVHCGAMLETDVHCDNCGSFHPTRR